MSGSHHESRQSGHTATRVIAFIGTFSTTRAEYASMADRIREHGLDVVLIDAGVVGEPQVTPRGMIDTSVNSNLSVGGDGPP